MQKFPIPIVACFFWAMLFGLVALSPNRMIYDEPLHFGTVEKLQKDGIVSAMTSHENQSAAGPLYAYLHSELAFLTNMQPPNIRWLNVFALLVVAFIVAGLQNSMDQSFYQFSLSSLCLLGVPFVWPTVGMALTEIPAMVFFALSLLFLRLSSLAEKKVKVLTWAIAGGVALGIAILGRQTYLIVLPCIAIWSVFFRKCRLPTLLLILSAAAVCIWIFVIWEGLVPPSQRVVDGALRIDHALLAAAYVGVAGLILAPGLLLQFPVKIAALIFLSGAWLGLFATWGQIIPGKAVLIALLGEGMAPVIGGLMIAAMIGVALLWLACLAKSVLLKRDAFLLLNGLLLLAFIAAPAKISHLFSSRYVVTALVPLILLTGFENTRISILFKLVGALVGAATLASYYGWL